jgi:hypothetical protein
MNERDPNIVTSSLSGIVTEQGVTVRVNIIRLENEPNWSLEVENEYGTSTVCAPSSTRLSSYPSDVSTVSVRRSFDPSVRKLHFRAVTPY